MNQSEKRVHERHACEARINWSYANGKRCYPATIFNFGCNGAYLETVDKIEPNTTILLRLEAIFGDHMVLSEKECLPIVAFADVKWCHELYKENHVHYGAGLKYCGIK